MSNSARFLLFFVVIIVLNIILFYVGNSIFLNEPSSGWLGKIAEDSTEQVFYALVVPIAGIVIFDIAALVLFSKYGLKDE